MKRPLLSLCPFGLFVLLVLTPAVSEAQIKKQPPAPASAPNLKELEAGIRAHMGFLASDALGGRGSATVNERIACEYVAAQWAQWGIQPAGDADENGKKSYLQKVTIPPRGGTAGEPRYTYNVVGVLPGSDTRSEQAVLFSAHIDHLGDRRSASPPAAPAVAAPSTDATPADTIYNGADDDASGVAAVLEIARVLGRGPAPKRTVYFACFGSEERGGYGAAEFLKRPPTPLENIVCNLEFEMIGRPDPKVAANELWLTGYDRSNLGPELRKQGAKIVADPHPEQNFFFRSDNIQLARRGVVAQTVSSFGLHPQYHRADDDLAHIDFAHMTRAIASILSPARYLANSDFVPTWVEGKRP